MSAYGSALPVIGSGGNAGRRWRSVQRRWPIIKGRLLSRMGTQRRTTVLCILYASGKDLQSSAVLREFPRSGEMSFMKGKDTQTDAVDSQGSVTKVFLKRKTFRSVFAPSLSPCAFL